MDRRRSLGAKQPWRAAIAPFPLVIQAPLCRCTPPKNETRSGERDSYTESHDRDRDRSRRDDDRERRSSRRRSRSRSRDRDRGGDRDRDRGERRSSRRSSRSASPPKRRRRRPTLWDVLPVDGVIPPLPGVSASAAPSIPGYGGHCEFAADITRHTSPPFCLCAASCCHACKTPAARTPHAAACAPLNPHRRHATPCTRPMQPPTPSPARRSRPRATRGASTSAGCRPG